MSNVSVLGCGRWASFLAWYSHKLGHHTLIYGREGSARLTALQQTHQNEYLTLSEEIGLTSDLRLAIKGAAYIIISISTQSLRSFLKQIAQLNIVTPNQTFILCMKGLEIGSGKRLSQVFAEEMPVGQVAVWVGPGHVQSFTKNIPNCMVIDADNQSRKERIIDAFGSNLVRFYYGTDLIGNEIGAATKNVIGLAAGMLDGLGLTALKGALMARAPHEVARLIIASGGEPITAYGLAHLGDYEATLFSPHSNNRRYGEDFVRGITSEKLAEGVPTLQAVMDLSEKYQLDSPISNCLYNIIYRKAQTQTELDKLFARPLKHEFVSDQSIIDDK